MCICCSVYTCLLRQWNMFKLEHHQNIRWEIKCFSFCILFVFDKFICNIRFVWVKKKLEKGHILFPCETRRFVDKCDHRTWQIWLILSHWIIRRNSKHLKALFWRLNNTIPNKHNSPTYYSYFRFRTFLNLLINELHI